MLLCVAALVVLRPFQCYKMVAGYEQMQRRKQQVAMYQQQQQAIEHRRQHSMAEHLRRLRLEEQRRLARQQQLQHLLIDAGFFTETFAQGNCLYHKTLAEYDARENFSHFFTKVAPAAGNDNRNFRILKYDVKRNLQLLCGQSLTGMQPLVQAVYRW